MRLRLALPEMFARRTTTTTTMAIFPCEPQWPTKQYEERWDKYCAGTGAMAWAMTKDCTIAWPGPADTALEECRDFDSECVIFDTNREKCGRTRASTTSTTTTTTTTTINATAMAGSGGGGGEGARAANNGTAAGNGKETAPLGLNATQLFLSLDVNRDGSLTYTDVSDYCKAQAEVCDAAELASALSLELELDVSVPGVDLATFAAGMAAGTIVAAGQNAMAAIVVAANAEPTPGGEGGGKVAKAQAMARCMRAGEQWLPCATTNECYKTKTQCDGGVSDCADGSDEDPAVCNPPTPGAARGGTDDSIAALPEATEDAPSSDEIGMGATVAIVLVALLAVAGVVVACWVKNKGGGGGIDGDGDGKRIKDNDDDEQAQGVSISFANPSFKMPERFGNGDGDLYETNEVPQPSSANVNDMNGGYLNTAPNGVNGTGAQQGTSYLDTAPMPISQPGAGAKASDSYLNVQSAGALTSSDMDIQVPDFDAIGGMLSKPETTYDLCTAGLQHNMEGTAVYNLGGSRAPHAYDLEDPTQGGVYDCDHPDADKYGPMDANLEDPTQGGTYDNDYPDADKYGPMDTARQKRRQHQEHNVYDHDFALPGPRGASGSQAMYDLEDPTKAAYGTQKNFQLAYDLGHEDARGPGAKGNVQSNYDHLAGSTLLSGGAAPSNYDHLTLAGSVTSTYGPMTTAGGSGSDSDADPHSDSYSAAILKSKLGNQGNHDDNSLSEEEI